MPTPRVHPRSARSRAASMLLILALLTLGQLTLAPTAPACACGAAPTPENVKMTGESALITWDGRRENIDMVLRLGGPASEAAWIMPTPAGSELGLGDNGLWRGLAQAVEPEQVWVPDWTPRFDFQEFGERPGVGGGGAATVEGVVDIGPFRVTTLAGDASSVNDWLQANDYPARPELTPTFQEYLDQGWRLQAVRLIPEASGKTFQSTLPPLRISFATDRVVYPIRLSRHAGGDQEVTLYLAAPHRMAISTDAAPDEPLTLLYAGWRVGAQVGRPEGLTPDGRVFLTAWSGRVSPAAFVGDYAFTPAPQDDKFVRTIERPDHTPGRILGGVILALPVLAAAVLLVVMLRRRRRHG